MIILQSILAAIIPTAIYVTIIYYVDRYEKEPIWLLAATFLWGALPAVIFALLLNALLGLPFYILFGDSGETATAVLVAPLVEESIKGLALLFILFLWRQEIDGPLDGIIYGAMVGMGFAMVENVFYFVQEFEIGGLEAWQSNIFLRAFVFGLNHSLFSAMTGLGIATARMSKSQRVRLLAPVLGWSMAVFLHFVHNASASSAAYIGAFACIPLLTNAWGGVLITLGIIIWALWQEKQWIRQYLSEEAAAGIITTRQYQNASSGFLRLFHRLDLLTTHGLRGYINARRFYLRCSQLAYAKHHYTLLNDQKSLERATKLRTQVAHLSRTIL